MNIPNKALLIFGLIVGTVGVVIIVLTTTTKFKKEQETNIQIPIASLTPSPTSTQPQVKYNPEKNDQLLNNVINRQTLTSSDVETKQKLINKLNGKSGILQKTIDYQLEYILSPDLFQVEILNTDVNFAKKQATTWLIQQGFSLNGLCKLPVMFYLNQEVKNDLSNTDIEFNPLPEG